MASKLKRMIAVALSSTLDLSGAMNMWHTFRETGDTVVDQMVRSGHTPQQPTTDAQMKRVKKRRAQKAARKVNRL